MLKVSILSKKDEQELIRMTRQEKGYIALRAQLILWASEDQQSIPQLAKRMGWSEERTRHWIKRFLKEGPKGLYDRPGRGRKSKQTAKIKEQIEKVLDESKPPEHTGYSFWTVPLLMGWLLASFGIGVHISTVRRWILNLGYRFNRPKTEPKRNDPKKDSRLKKISKLFETVKSPDIILYEDETTLRLLPLIRGMWMKIAKQFSIKTKSGWNKSIKVFGVLNPITGDWTYRFFDKCNKENFIAFLQLVLETYPTGNIHMIADRASWHTAHLVEDWLALHPRIELVWLPTGCPKLNPVERIWRRLKDQVAANRWYGTLKAIRRSAEGFLDSLSPEKTLRLSGLDT